MIKRMRSVGAVSFLLPVLFISDVTEKLYACDLRFYYTWADILKTGVHESDFDEKERIWPEALI